MQHAGPDLRPGAGARPPLASLVIPHYGDDRLLSAATAAVALNTESGTYELVVVDNNTINRGFAAGCNAGADLASGGVLVFLNNDTEVRSGWLPPLLAALDDPTVGAVGAKLVYPDGRVQHAGVALRMVANVLEAYHADAALADVARDCPAVTGACLAIRRDVFAAARGFDEGYWNGYEDVDLCLTLGDLGYRVRYEPASVVMHHESAGGTERWRAVRQNIARLQEKWLGRVRI